MKYNMKNKIKLICAASVIALMSVNDGACMDEMIIETPEMKQMFADLMRTEQNLIGMRFQLINILSSNINNMKKLGYAIENNQPININSLIEENGQNVQENIENFILQLYSISQKISNKEPEENDMEIFTLKNAIFTPEDAIHVQSPDVEKNFTYLHDWQFNFERVCIDYWQTLPIADNFRKQLYEIQIFTHYFIENILELLRKNMYYHRINNSKNKQEKLDIITSATLRDEGERLMEQNSLLRVMLEDID